MNDLRITIEGKAKSGKTTVTQLLMTTLHDLGADVTLRADVDGDFGNIRDAKRVLKGKKITLVMLQAHREEDLT